MADVLRTNTRENDLIGRWGGEEFLIVCPSTVVEGALKLGEILCAALDNNALASQTPQTASFGVAAIQQDEKVRELVKRADLALYQAKGEGRNRVIAAAPAG